MSTLDYNKIMSENGSSNYSVFVIDGLCYLISQDYALYRTNDTLKEKIVDGPIGAFQIGRQHQRIFYQTEDNSLWSCTLDGSERLRILGGNGDEVRSFVINSDYAFIVIEDRAGVWFLYQLSQDLQNASILKQSTARMLVGGADQQYLYYHTFSNPNEHTLFQYDIRNKKEIALLNGIGIRALQLYQNHIVMQIYKNCMSPYDTPEVVIFDPQRKTMRSLIKMHVEELNCYLDHAFYIQKDTETIWTIPLEGGPPHQLWNKPASILNLSMGSMFFIDCADRTMKHVSLADSNDSATQAFPNAALESIKDNYLLNDKPEAYWGRSTEDILNDLVPDYPFDAEVYDYVVFLSLPQLNKEKENLSSLLAVGGYKQTQNNKPILFIDCTPTHSRKKGFIAATDGIHTPKTFFPYDYTFTCERTGIQELTAEIYSRVRYGDTRKKLRIDCPMYKNGLDDTAALIEAVYVFSYFGQKNQQQNYQFPLPTEKEPLDIAEPAEPVLEEFLEWNEAASEAPAIVSGQQETSPKISKVNAESLDTSTTSEQRLKYSNENVSPYKPATATPSKVQKKVSSEETFELAMDALWKPEVAKIRCYNFWKFIFTTIWFTAWILLLALDHPFLASIAIGGGILLITVLLLLIQEGIKTAEMRKLEEKYAALGINTYYTPIGFRGPMFAVMLIISFLLAFSIEAIYCNFFMSL